jgi:hypothetical protein
LKWYDEDVHGNLVEEDGAVVTEEKLLYESKAKKRKHDPDALSSVTVCTQAARLAIQILASLMQSVLPY